MNSLLSNVVSSCSRQKTPLLRLFTTSTPSNQQERRQKSRRNEPRAPRPLKLGQKRVSDQVLKTYSAPFYDGVSTNIRENADNPLALDPNLRPLNIAYFTDNPHYYNLILRLNDTIRRNNLSFDDAKQYEDVHLPPWMQMSEMGGALGIKLDQARYDEIIHKLSILYVNRELDSTLTDVFFANFIKPGTSVEYEEKPAPTLDEHGRAFGKGSKKSARAAAYTIEGKGKVLVNGLPASDYFNGRLSLLDEMISPLMATETVGKLNVWAHVRGGGYTGQAQAIKLAIARCVAVHDPEYQVILEKGGFLMPDTRQVERKKTNQPKARKKFQWVRR